MASPGHPPVEPDHPKDNPKTPSWVSVVQNKQTLSKHNLNVSITDGAPTVVIPDDVIEDAPPLWEDFLIGKFLTKAPHVAKVHVIVNKIWTLGDKSVRVDAYVVNDVTIKFRIRESSIRNRVLRRGMWNIADVPMVISKWSPVTEAAQPEIKSIPMWVILKNVPHQMFSWKGLGFLASSVGTPKRLHPDTETCKSFEDAKIFVEADLMKELPKSFRFKSDKGIDAVIEFKYPWLPVRCTTCSKWGHLAEVCIVGKGQGRYRARGTEEGGKEKENIENVEKVGLKKKEDPVTIISLTSSEHLDNTLVMVQKEKELDQREPDTILQEMKAKESDEERMNEQRKDDFVDKSEAEVTTKKGMVMVLVSSDSGKDVTIPATETITVDSETTHVQDITQRQKTEKEKKNETSWSKVSPAKTGRSIENTPVAKSLGSPSRFSILSEENQDESEEVESENSDHSEEGEIIQREEVIIQKEEEFVHQEKHDTRVLRAPLPRSTKGTNKFLAESFALNTRESTPSVSGRKKSSKK